MTKTSKQPKGETKITNNNFYSIFLFRNNDGKKMIQNKTIPEKKKIENKKFLII